jgi:hypothetical protein
MGGCDSIPGRDITFFCSKQRPLGWTSSLYPLGTGSIYFYYTFTGWGHYATSRKVAGSIPDEVIGFFIWPNPSSHTMSLGSTQPLTEMNTRNSPWGNGKMWEPRRLTTLWAFTACYRDSFTFFFPLLLFLMVHKRMQTVMIVERDNWREYDVDGRLMTRLCDSGYEPFIIARNRCGSYKRYYLITKRSISGGIPRGIGQSVVPLQRLRLYHRNI